MSGGCDIRLDRRPTGWLVTVTIDGYAETFSASYPDTVSGAMEAAAHGVLVAVRRHPHGRPQITARGVGAHYIHGKAQAQGLECEIRTTHPNRGRRLPS